MRAWLNKEFLFFFIIILSPLFFYTMTEYVFSSTQQYSLEEIEKKQIIMQKALSQIQSGARFLEGALQKSLTALKDNQQTISRLSQIICCWKKKTCEYIEQLENKIDAQSIQVSEMNFANHQTLIDYESNQANLENCQQSYQNLLTEHTALQENYSDLSQTFSLSQHVCNEEKNEIKMALNEFELQLETLITSNQKNNETMSELLDKTISLASLGVGNYTLLLDELSYICDYTNGNSYPEPK